MILIIQYDLLITHSFYNRWWVLLIAFEDLFPFIKQCTDFLEKIISWPRIVGSAMIRGDNQFPAPW